MFFAQPIAGAAFNLIDYFTGGMFHCEEDLNLYVPSILQDQSIPQYKRRLIIFPPRVSDPKLREKMITKWKKEIEQLKINNYEVVDIEKTWETLLDHGLSFNELKKPSEMRPERSRKLGLKLQFTHILYFDYELRGDRYIFFPQIYSLVNKKLEDDSKLLRVVEVEDTEGAFFKFFWKTFNILPNSINLGYEDARVDEENYQTTREEHPNQLPAYIRYFSLGTSIDAEAFDNWQTGYYFSPAFFADSWSLKRNSEDGIVRDHIDLQYYQFLYGPSVFWKTPFNTFYFSVFTGPGYFKVDSNLEGVSESKLTSSISFQFRIQYHLTQKWSINLAYRKNNRNVPGFNNNEINDYESLYVNLSYFFPEGQEQLKELFR